MELDVVAAQRMRLSDTISALMIDWISVGGLEPGTPLPSEAELARRFSVSKPVIREALGRLSTLGAVQIRQGRPTVVAEMTSRPLTEFFSLAVQMKSEGLREAVELRRAIETQTAALAAERATEEDIEDLRAQTNRMAAEESTEGWIEADIEFHLRIAQTARNSLISFLMDALQETMRFSIRSLQHFRGQHPVSKKMEHHLALLAAIEKHDPAAAAQAMDLHFDSSRALIHQILAEQTRAAPGDASPPRVH